jgi:hypothetical protein
VDAATPHARRARRRPSIRFRSRRRAATAAPPARLLEVGERDHRVDEGGVLGLAHAAFDVAEDRLVEPPGDGRSAAFQTNCSAAYIQHFVDFVSSVDCSTHRGIFNESCHAPTGNGRYDVCGRSPQSDSPCASRRASETRMRACVPGPADEVDNTEQQAPKKGDHPRKPSILPTIAKSSAICCEAA